MKTIEYHNFDKSNWLAGEWQSEPDKKQWEDETTKLPCLIVRSSIGHLCGYVGISKEHPWYGKDYDNMDIDIHGGVTFTGSCMSEKNKNTSICHIVETGEPDDVWWIGFDCAHCDDRTGINGKNTKFFKHGIYRNMTYVEQQIKKLAQQLMELAG